MAKKIINPFDIKDELVQDLRSHLGENLLSVIIHGSACTKRYMPGRSDVNIIIVVQNDSIKMLEDMNRLEKRWGARRVFFSFFFTPEYISDSVDAYPLEFFEIQCTHLLLYGRDYFKDLCIKKSDLRLECERELRGKLLHLKREFIRRRQKAKLLVELLKVSFSQVMVIARGLFYVAGRTKIPDTHPDLCPALAEILDIDTGTLRKIANQIVIGDFKQINQLFYEYIPAIERLLAAVDGIKIID